MTSCNSEEEFESTWQKMMNEYKLHDHVWLSNMYKIRHKWSTAFSKDVFSADIKSSQRSESTNSALGEIVGGSTSIEIDGYDNVSNHEVILNHMPQKKHIVSFDSSTTMINCSCHKFDSMGILCSHALRIYNIKGVLRIPNQYFLKRWSKNARSKIYEHMNGALKEVSTSNLNSMTNDDNASLLYRNAIINKVHLNPNAATNDRCFNQNEENHHSQMQNPPLAKTKGMSSTCKKGHFEKRKRTATKVKKNKEKQKEGEFSDTYQRMEDQSNVQTWMDETFNVTYASLEEPLQVDHPSNTMSLNASIAKSALYRPQMASTVMPLVWPQIPQSLHGMQPVRPPPIRPPISNGSQFMNASQLVETVQMTQLRQVQK
ncbi:Zinc finger, PMZ-type [Sesbania bispinosa]|nr:Zinc finger, PMZ-type [Sesbania bispinosa]